MDTKKLMGKPIGQAEYLARLEGIPLVIMSIDGISTEPSLRSSEEQCIYVRVISDLVTEAIMPKKVEFIL